MDRISLLKESGLVKDMSDKEIAQLAGVGEERRYTKGTTIIKEDSRSRDLYVVDTGRVSIRLTLPTETGREEVIYTMREGQIFGELSLVDGSPRSATVRAEEDVRALYFEFSKLSELLDREPRIGYYLMRNIAAIISQRVRNTNLLWRNSIIW